MSGRIGNLSKNQEEILKQFRVNLCDVLQEKHDDHFLLRWLRARSFDLKKSEKMIRDNLEWRRKMDIDTLRDTFEPPEVLQKYYPGGLHGFDKEGSPIWIETVGYSDQKGILYSAKKSDILKYKLTQCETIEEAFLTQTKKLGKRVDGLVILMDMSHYGRKHLWRPAVSLYLEILAIFEANYPEMLKRCYVVNAPRVFPFVYNLIKPVLSEDTVKKCHVIGSNWKEKILEDIDADQLPVHWGGTATDPDGDVFCRSKIGMGGEVPKEYYLKDQQLVNIESFTKATVGRGSQLLVECPVAHDNCLIRYQFKTDGKDIGFGVYRVLSSKENGKKSRELEEIQPVQRLNSHMVPEDGMVSCAKTGTYILKFDNSYSWVNSKKLWYNFEVLEKADTSDIED